MRVTVRGSRAIYGAGMRLITVLFGSVVVVVIGIVAALNVMGVDVVLTNTGSQSVHVRGALPPSAETALSAAGIRVPEELPPGVPTVVRVPKLSGIVRTSSSAVDLSLLGQTMHFDASCDRLDLNGASLLGRSIFFDLAATSRTELQFACH